MSNRAGRAWTRRSQEDPVRLPETGGRAGSRAFRELRPIQDCRAPGRPEVPRILALYLDRPGESFVIASGHDPQRERKPYEFQRTTLAPQQCLPRSAKRSEE